MKNKIKGSFMQMLINNYIGFTFLLFILGVIITVILIFSMFFMLGVPSYDSIEKFSDKLETGSYSEIPVERLFGKDSSFNIINMNNESVYNSSGEEGENYTKGELDCIPQYNSSVSITTKNFVTNQNQEHTLIMFNDSEEENSNENQFIVLDRQLNVVYSTFGDTRTSFTKKEYGYLTGSYPKNWDIQKYEFKDGSGEKFVMVITMPDLEVASDQFFKKAIGFIEIAMMAFGICFLLVTAGLFTRLNHKVQRPLNILSNAMESYETRRVDNPIVYSGPTEFVKICNSFNHMVERLKESDDRQKQLEIQKQQMLTDISHDLKTPITVIQGYAKAICDRLVAEEEKEEYLQIIYKKTIHLSDLINSFYEYSKLEHPDFGLKLEECDICEFSRNYLIDKYDEIEQAGFELELEIPEEKVLCDIDKVQMKRVFENIISNAIKHNENGTKLLFSLKEKENSVIIHIADSGKGIPKEIADNIFMPFVVGDESRNNKQGSGLGLAICKKIVKEHGGELQLVCLEDEYYKTKFEIILFIK